MTQDDLTAIQREAEESLNVAKLSLQTDNATEQQFEVARDGCEEKVTAVKSVINYYEDEMENLKRLKRELDTEMGELRLLQRPWINIKEELQHYAKRTNNEFWSLRKITNKPT